MISSTGGRSIIELKDTTYSFIKKETILDVVSI